MVKQTNKITQDTKQDIKSLKKDYISAVGRRKGATAVVRLYESDVNVWGTNLHKGEIVVNNKSALEYFGNDKELIYREPLDITNTKNKFAISVRVSGGGKVGQLDSAILGIARALDKWDREKFHTILKRNGMLTRDSRIKERRKVGMGGKSRRLKQSPKR